MRRWRSCRGCGVPTRDVGSPDLGNRYTPAFSDAEWPVKKSLRVDGDSGRVAPGNGRRFKRRWRFGSDWHGHRLRSRIAWQRHHERRARSQAALHEDPTAVHVHDRFHDREAEPAATAARLVLARPAEEPFEDVRQFGGVDADARIADLDLGARPASVAARPRRRRCAE